MRDKQGKSERGLRVLGGVPKLRRGRKQGATRHVAHPMMLQKERVCRDCKENALRGGRGKCLQGTIPDPLSLLEAGV